MEAIYLLTPSQYQWGFCFVKGVPVDPESTKTLIERIAHVRHTHYGMYSFQSYPLLSTDGDLAKVAFGILLPISLSKTPHIRMSFWELIQITPTLQTLQGCNSSTCCRTLMEKGERAY